MHHCQLHSNTNALQAVTSISAAQVSSCQVLVGTARHSQITFPTSAQHTVRTEPHTLATLTPTSIEPLRLRDDFCRRSCARFFSSTAACSKSRFSCSCLFWYSVTCKSTHKNLHEQPQPGYDCHSSGSSSSTSCRHCSWQCGCNSAVIRHHMCHTRIAQGKLTMESLVRSGVQMPPA